MNVILRAAESVDAAVRYIVPFARLTRGRDHLRDGYVIRHRQKTAPHRRATAINPPRLIGLEADWGD